MPQLRPFFIVFALLMGVACYGQRVKSLNLATYDKEKLHFGFSLGINKADFSLLAAHESVRPDSMLSSQAIPDWGFNLGIVSDLRLHEYLTIRFLPGLTFQGRTIEYEVRPTGALKPDSTYFEKKKVESTLLDFPLNLKLRSERLNNMSMYLVGGGKFSLDLASQEKTNNDDIVKLNPKDYSLEIGLGLDFYLEYFKFSTELKFSQGLRNRLINENTAWSMPIEKLGTKVWLISLHFEG